MPLWPKEGLVVPKVFTPKNCISHSHGRWALGFCMGATQSLSTFINIGWGPKRKKTIVVKHHCYPGRHAWRQACPFHYLLVHQWCAVGSAV